MIGCSDDSRLSLRGGDSLVGSLRPKRALFQFYIDAKEHVWRCGYWREILDAEDITTQVINASTFAREMAWVVLGSGFREAIVRRIFADVTEAFCAWEVDRITRSADRCIRSAHRVFGHMRKLTAIADNCYRVAEIGVDDLLARARLIGPRYFTSFAYIGEVTCYHLAKNIGMKTVKPDRHLKRIAAAFGSDPFVMCDTLSISSGDPLGVVDLVLWRYASVTPNYMQAIDQALG